MRSRGTIYLTVCAVALSACCLARGGEPALVQPSTAETRSITLQPAAWSYAPATSEPELTRAPIPARPGASDPHLRSADSISASTLSAEIQYHTSSHVEAGRILGQWSVATVDLRTGAWRGPIALPPDLFGIAFTSDASRVALSGKDVHSSNSGIVYIADLTANSADPSFGFIPYASESRNSRAVAWAAFADSNHLLTRNDKYFVLWDLTGGRVRSVWSLKDEQYFGEHSILTPDGKYLVVINAKGTFFVEALTGRMAGVIDDPISESWNDFEYHDMQLVMRPDGRSLVRATSSHMDVFSLERAPQRISRIFMPPDIKVASIVWAGKDDVLVNHKYLVDVNKGMIVWTYGGLDDALNGRGALFAADQRVWVVTPEGNLSSFALPDASATAALGQLDLEKTMALRPGMRVTLAIDLPPGRTTDAIRAHMEEELKRTRMVLADNQPVVLRVQFVHAGQQTVVYRDAMGPNYGRERGVTVQDVKMSVTYEVDGKVLWEFDIVPGAPLLLSVHAGESLDAAVRRSQMGKWSQVQNLRLPEYVAELRDPPGFGQTLLTVQGPPAASAEAPRAPLAAADGKLKDSSPAPLAAPDSSPQNVQPAAPPDLSDGTLDPAFAAVIARAVADKKVVAGGAVGKGFSETAFTDVNPSGGLLVGFRYALTKFGNRSVLALLQPIYLTARGEVLGQPCGRETGQILQIKARKGYAVGAMTVAGTPLIISSISLDYMRIGNGKLIPDDHYSSETIGGESRRPPKIIGGDGTPIVGICGTLKPKLHLPSFALGAVFLGPTTSADPRAVNASSK